MNFAPVERPQQLLVRAAYWFSQRQFGKVMSALKVLYARRPALIGPARAINAVMKDRLSLDPELKHLLSAYVSRLNGCAYCRDITEAQAVRERVGTERFQALEDIYDSDVFNERERVALQFVEGLTREKQAPPKLLPDLERLFTAEEILDMVWLNAATNYYNYLAIPLGLESDHLREAAEKEAQ